MSTKIIIIVGIVLILIAVLSSVKKNSGARFISTKLGVPAGIIGVLLIIYASYSSDLVNYNRQIEQISIGNKLKIEGPLAFNFYYSVFSHWI